MRLIAFGAVLAGSSCAREPVAPPDRQSSRRVHAPHIEATPQISIAALLDSFAIGGVYTVLPRGGYSGGSAYARPPEKEQYAGTVRGHPTGLELPVGLPIRILAAGSYTSRATVAFQQDYCATAYGASDPICTIGSFAYSVHGLAAGPGVSSPYAGGTGLMLAWSRTAGYYERFFGEFPTAEFFRGSVPASDTATRRELHFSRAGCCYYIPWWTTAAWETYEGNWRFGAVPDDGGRAELGEAAVLRLRGPRTDAPMAAPAIFTAATATGDSITAARWWFVRAADNSFDGEPVPLVTVTQPFTLQIPRYPDGQRAMLEELVMCAGRTLCTYQANARGAVVVQATLADGRVLAARNVPAAVTIPVIQIDSVNGRNDEHSFTSMRGESVMVMGATVTNLPAGASVRWLVTDNPGMRGVSRVGPILGGGELASVSIPAQDSFARYEQPDSMMHKVPQPLSYRLVAEVFVGAAVVASDTAIVTQSPRDALRQEYLDYGIPLPGDHTLRSSVGFPSVRGYTLSELNQGDHAWFALQDTLLQTLPTTRDRFTDIMRRYGTRFQVTSVFRNPVHHRLHVALTSAQRRGMASRSNHQYGAAIDISVPPAFDALWWQLRADGKDRGACIEPRRMSPKHIHLDWRPTAQCARSQGW